MKKRVLILGLILILLLSGCTKVPDTYSVSVKGVELIVNLKNHTISHGDDTYAYVHTGIGVKDQKTEQTTFYYPNGGKWSIEEEFVGNLCVSSTVETSDDFDSIGYLPGETLLEAMKQASEKQSVIEATKPQINWGRLACGVFFLLFGALGLIFPEQMWNVRVALRRWRYKDMDPTETGMAAYQISSGILVVLGVIFILIAF